MRSHWKLLLPALFCAASAQAVDKKATERTWKAKCASCHGANGKGHTDQGKKMHLADLTSSKWKKATSDAKIKEVIENGMKKGDAEMEGYKDKLDPAQIDALVAYVRKLK
jgi:mono/diheme cytochrome c family protein